MLERDLHDGAQQLLLALSYHLRLARANGHAECADDATRLTDQAIDEVQAAIEELRRLAEGLYPTVLAEAGLAAALTSLSDITAIPIELSIQVYDRFGAAVEAVAYVTVSEAVSHAAERGATTATVSITQADASLRVSVTHDGVDTDDGFDNLADRVGALGGCLDTGHRGVTAVIPCG